MSFFQWLREGVRQAVVLGLADAVEDVGARNQGEDLGPALAQSLRERLSTKRESGAAVLDAPAAAPVVGAARRRLGRSIEAPPLRKAA
jgi:hypothetical protein